MLHISDFDHITLTKAERKSLQKVLEEVGDVWQPRFDEPEYFLKWMRLKNFNSKDIISLLKKDYEWRRSHAVDTVWQVGADHFPPVMQRCWPIDNICGEDREGRPVCILPVGAIDIFGILNSVSRKQIIFWVYWFLERTLKNMRDKCEQLGKKIDQMIIIADCEDLNMKLITNKVAFNIVLDLLDLIINHYPDFVYRGFVVNSPSVFNVIWSIVSPLLTDEMRSKVKKIEVEELLEYIDADQLPVYYGGTRVDENGDPKCSSMLNYAGAIPETYYERRRSRDERRRGEMLEAQIKRGSALTLQYELDRGETLRWEVISEQYDIKMGVYRRRSVVQQRTQDMDEVVAKDKYNTHLVPECGSYTCGGKPGSYVLRFDNDAWVTSKTVLYKVEILPPTSEDGEGGRGDPTH